MNSDGLSSGGKHEDSGAFPLNVERGRCLQQRRQQAELGGPFDLSKLRHIDADSEELRGLVDEYPQSEENASLAIWVSLLGLMLSALGMLISRGLHVDRRVFLAFEGAGVASLIGILSSVLIWQWRSHRSR